jgi:Flp pilus assembly CpaE family ATPase
VVAVTHDASGNGVVAEAAATAISSSGNQETVVADLDLRRAKAGRYYLSTTHEQDQAAYYYPLEIR